MQGRLTELTSRLEGLEIDIKKFTATIQQVNRTAFELVSSGF